MRKFPYLILTGLAALACGIVWIWQRGVGVLFGSWSTGIRRSISIRDPDPMRRDAERRRIEGHRAGVERDVRRQADEARVKIGEKYRGDE